MMTTMDIIYENLKSKSFLFANLAPRILFIPFLKINFLLFFLFVFVFLFCFFVCSTVNLLKWIHTRTEISFLMTFLVVTFPHNIDTLRIVNFCEFFFFSKCDSTHILCSFSPFFHSYITSIWTFALSWGKRDFSRR